MTKLAFILLVSLVGCSTDSEAPAVDAGTRRPDADRTDAPAADAPGPCAAQADTCTGETICIAGSCEPAFGRFYDIGALSVSLPATDPNGYYWDFAGGAPDIFVRIHVNGALRATTTGVTDQFTAMFAGPYPVQPIGGGWLELVAYDEDVTTSELAFTCTANPLTAAQLRSRKLACAAGGSTMSFTIEPR